MITGGPPIFNLLVIFMEGNMFVVWDEEALFENAEVFQQFFQAGKWKVHGQIALAGLHVVDRAGNFQLLQQFIRVCFKTEL